MLVVEVDTQLERESEGAAAAERDKGGVKPRSNKEKSAVILLYRESTFVFNRWNAGHLRLCHSNDG